MNQIRKVVIVGAGFGGLQAAKALKDAPVEVVLVDKNNYHSFQPLLYQVATAALEPEEIAHSIRGIYHGQKNLHFRLAEVVGIEWQEKRLLVREGVPIAFDYLILAAGATTNYFGIEGVQKHAFPLKSVPEAINIRSHVMRQFEQVDTNPELIQDGALTFVVVGGGPTGVEMAGALMELFKMVLSKDFPRLEVAQARVLLVEAQNGLLAPFHEKLRQNALQTLRKQGVEVLLNEYVTRATADAVYLKSGTMIPTQTLIWAAGVRANPLANMLGLEQTRGGRLVVNNDLSVPEHENVFVIGDMAASKDKSGTLHPQLAQVAIQGANHVGEQIKRHLNNQPRTPFSYSDLGIMATIGRHAAVAELPSGLRFSGTIAWLMWLFLHLMYIVGFRNRLNVFINWMWNYFTYDRSARLIFEVMSEENKQKNGELPL